MLERQPSLKHTRTLLVNTERSALYVPVSKQTFEKIPKLTLVAHIQTHYVYTQREIQMWGFLMSLFPIPLYGNKNKPSLWDAGRPH